MLTAPDRVAILLHSGILGTQGKTGLALIRYTEAEVVAVIDHQCAGQSLEALTGMACTAPIVGSVVEALVYQPTVLAIGIAPAGGIVPAEWIPELKIALTKGLKIANGLHTRLADHPDLQSLLHDPDQIWDMRQEPPGLKIASAQARYLSCQRVLTVGTDMSVGKMSTSLELHRAGLTRGLASKFIGTGQAGLMIAGDGIALDAVRVDFAAGAVEKAVMTYGHDFEMLHIEGQGSFIHPGSTATLPLIRGSQPTHLVLVHRAGQTSVRNHPTVPIPPLKNVIHLYETVAQAGGAFGAPKVAAIALNTAHLSEPEAQAAIDQTRAEIGLPCTDVVRYGGGELLDAIVKG
jgi:uncharacterized NAD-dependent epimerase/dehydratase family protein